MSSLPLLEDHIAAVLSDESLDSPVCLLPDLEMEDTPGAPWELEAAFAMETDRHDCAVKQQDTNDADHRGLRGCRVSDSSLPTVISSPPLPRAAAISGYQPTVAWTATTQSTILTTTQPLAVAVSDSPSGVLRHTSSESGDEDDDTEDLESHSDMESVTSPDAAATLPPVVVESSPIASSGTSTTTSSRRRRTKPRTRSPRSQRAEAPLLPEQRKLQRTLLAGPVREAVGSQSAAFINFNLPREPRAGRKPRRVCREGDSCAWCGVSESHDWRKGPSGLRNLCNACGLRYHRQLVKSRQLSSDPPVDPAQQTGSAPKIAPHRTSPV